MTATAELTIPDGRLSRRTLLRGLLGTGAAAAAAVALPARAEAEEVGASDVVLDVACLADTFRFIPAPGFDPPGASPVYGSPFLVEGNIFDGGALDGRDGFDPRDPAGPAVTGTWVCRGWLMMRDERPLPEVVSTQLYLFPPLGDGTAPQAQLVSEGLEGFPDGVTRTVAGGTGPYAGVLGSVVQTTIGTNATEAGPVGLLGAGPNFRFAFHLVFPGSRKRRNGRPSKRDSVKQS